MIWETVVIILSAMAVGYAIGWVRGHMRGVLDGELNAVRKHNAWLRELSELDAVLIDRIKQRHPSFAPEPGDVKRTER